MVIASGSFVFSLDNPVFRAFITYALIVLGKTLLMSILTAVQRFKNNTFANAEDTKGKFQPVGHPDVERVRRCHQNDLENVIPFVLIGLLYVASRPALSTAIVCFRCFAVSRLAHTVSYLAPLPQPCRALCFLCGFATTIFMAYQTASRVGVAL